MNTSIYEELDDLKKELMKIKEIIVTEERLIQILKEELGTQESKYKNGFEKIQRQILQIKVNNNSSKNSGIDFSDFQMPPDLPWGNTLEPKKKKDKEKLIE